MGKSSYAEIESMGNWLEGALSALIQSGTPLHSVTVEGDASGVAICLSDGRVVLRKRGEERAPSIASRPSKVYLIAASTGHIKIGIAQNVKKRLQGLQNAHGEPLEVLATFDGGRDLEQKLHKALKAYRLKGEWFRRGPWLDAMLAAETQNESQILRRVRKALQP